MIGYCVTTTYKEVISEDIVQGSNFVISVMVEIILISKWQFESLGGKLGRKITAIVLKENNAEGCHGNEYDSL